MAAPRLAAAASARRALVPVPTLSVALSKGQCGRVAVVGGCEEYSGAPYFSAMAALKMGADLSHVVCDANAGTVIKSYSPELIVHPYLRTTDSAITATGHPPVSEDAIVARCAALLPKFHCLVVGPGMGRSPLMLSTVVRVIGAARDAQLPMVLDADALYLLCQGTNLSLVRGYPLAVVTPNATEYPYLCKAAGIAVTSSARELADALGVAVIRKGSTDQIAGVIAAGSEQQQQRDVECDEPSGLRRFGGQGDVLTGVLSTLIAWSRLGRPELTALDPAVLELGCRVTRGASHRAYTLHARGTTTGHVLEALPHAFEDVFGPEVPN
ncbi:Ribokinase-like protein [Blastocladiella britannica]|nr:Ribokinase-like protein [Blastocladiella britannica]